MKTIGKTNLMALFVVSALAGPAAQAASFVLTPQAGPIIAGDVFTVTWGGTGFSGTFGGSAIIGFDNTAVEYLESDTVFDPAFSEFTFDFAKDASHRSVGVSSGFGAPVTVPNFDIATFSFKALKAGSFNITAFDSLHDWVKNNDNQDTYILNPTTVSISGSITPNIGGNPVPVPAAIWLLGSALIGLVKLGPRRA